MATARALALRINDCLPNDPVPTIPSGHQTNGYHNGQQLGILIFRMILVGKVPLNQHSPDADNLNGEVRQTSRFISQQGN